MCGVTPPVPLIDPLLDAIFEAIRRSPVRVYFLDVLAVMFTQLTAVLEGSVKSSTPCARFDISLPLIPVKRGF